MEASDPEGVFSTALSPFANLNAGAVVSSSVALATTTRIGDFTGSYTLSFADENLPGATALGSMVLQVSGRVSGAFDIAEGQTRTIAEAVGGNGTVSKSGAGTLVFAANNSYTGATAVNVGRLVVNGTNTASAVTVNNGGTLGGSGRVGSLSLGGLVAPGNSVGVLGAGSTVLAVGGAFELEIFDWNSTPGTGWDLLEITGNLTLSNTPANRFTINLVSLQSSSTPGLSLDWDQNVNWTNTFITYSGSLLGEAFSADLFTVNTGAFGNSFNGTFSITNVTGGLALLYSTSFIGEPSFVWESGSGLWSEAGNWTNGALPASNSIAVFSGAGGSSINNAVARVGGLVFSNSAGSYTLSGDTLTIGAQGIVNNSAGSQIISHNVVLGAEQTFAASVGSLVLAGAVDNNGHLLTVGGAAGTDLQGIISGSGGLTKNGGGTMTLGGSNTFGGPLTVNAGTVLVNAVQSTASINVSGGVVNLGGSGRLAGSAAVSVSSGALNLAGNETVGAVQITGGTIGGSGVLTGTVYDVQGGTISAVLGGSATLTKSGAGAATISGNNISYSGPIDVQAGLLVAAHGQALGANAITLTNGGIGAASGTTLANNFTIGAGGPQNYYTQTFNELGAGLPSGWTVRTSATSSSLGNLTNLNTTNPTSWGNSAGASRISRRPRDWYPMPSVTVQSNLVDRALGVRQVGTGGYDPGASINYAFSTAGLEIGSISLDLMLLSDQPRSTTWTFQFGLGAAPTSFTTLGSWTPMRGAASLLFTTNDFGASLNGQSDVLFRVVALSPSTGSLARDSMGIDNFIINTLAPLSGSGSLGIYEAGSATFTGAISNNTIATLTAAEGGSAGFTGIISGAGAITKTGAGTVTLSGANTFAGGVRVEAGALRLAHGSAAGFGEIVQTDGSSVLEIDTLADITNNMSVYNLAFLQSGRLSGNLRLNNATFFVAEEETSTLSGILTSEEGGSGGVTKTGAGRLVLTGNNTYIGPTDVQAGILELATVGGSAAGATASVSVASGAILLLSQSHQVNNSATVSLSGGTIQRASGVSEVFGNLNVITASVLDFSGGAGGTLDFSGLDNDYTPSSFKALQLLNFTQGNTLIIRNTQDWANEINSGFTFGGTGGFGSSSFSEGTFTITAIPEPSTYVTAAGLIAMLLWPIRRRLLGKLGPNG